MSFGRFVAVFICHRWFQSKATTTATSSSSPFYERCATCGASTTATVLFASSASLPRGPGQTDGRLFKDRAVRVMGVWKKWPARSKSCHPISLLASVSLVAIRFCDRRIRSIDLFSPLFLSSSGTNPWRGRIAAKNINSCRNRYKNFDLRPETTHLPPCLFRCGVSQHFPPTAYSVTAPPISPAPAAGCNSL